jgi:hypothetical protein
VGVFLGTSVNNFGNFTPGLTFELFPGVQLLAGSTFWSKTTLVSGLTACSGYSNSPSFPISPSSSEDDTAIDFTAATTGSSPTPSVNVITDTKKTTTTSTVSGCTNGDKATIVSGTTVQTQSSYKPAFSFGVIFNTNLSKAFASVFH